jgi:hypothetical protein
LITLANCFKREEILRLDIYEKYKLRESIPSQKKRSNTAKPVYEEETTQNSEWII